MKKFSILGLCALIGMGAMAQESVLKEAEKAAKGNSIDEVITIITPAFSDPTTSKMAQTYYIPGKMAFKIFDNYLGEQAITGTLQEDKKAQMPQLLVYGYDFLSKALPLDSVVEVDKKGVEKIKTKYSKDIFSSFVGHYPDLSREGNEAFNSQDYENAHKLWSYYVELPQKPEYAKALAKVIPHDTILGEINFYRGFASTRLENNEQAFAEFAQAIKQGYKKKDAYDYAIYIGQQIGNDEGVVALCEEAHNLYGAETPNYLGQIINTYLNKKDYDKALRAIDKALAERPSAEYYVIKGVVLERSEDPSAIDQYKKALSLDPENAQANAYYGRLLADKAIQIYNDAPTEGPEFSRVFNEQFKPLMGEAIQSLEKAYTLNNDDIDSVRYLEQAYYLLNDAENLSRVQTILKTF